MSREIRLTLTRPHRGQVKLAEARERYLVVDCGRRFGKSVDGLNRLTTVALAGGPVAWFAPNYKMLAEAWRDFRRRLRDVTASASKQDKRIELITGGSIEFWTLEDPDAGRSRRYRRVVIDEAAKARHLEEAWTKAIRPTLTDFKGDAVFYSTPRGRDYFWKLFVRGEDPLEPDWRSFRFPTTENPWIDPAEVEAARRELPDRTFRQEYLAEFLEDAGGVFRNVADCIDRGRVLPEDRRRVGAYALGVDLARLYDFTVLTVVDNMGRQVYFERFNQISWERQIAAIKAASAKYSASVIVDSTGVGDPIFERLKDAGLRVEPYVFTASSKPPLIDDLAMAFERGSLRLMDVPEQEAELAAYEYVMTKARNWRTSAPEGMHDDCVMALALAWHGAKAATDRPPRGGIW
jgi:hypothetical protein